MIVQHFIGAVVPPPLQSFCKFTFNGNMIFPKRISVKLGLLTQNLAQNCPPKPDKSEHEVKIVLVCNEDE